MSAELIDGKWLAQSACNEIEIRVMSLVDRGIKPRLAVIFVGDDPASEVYVRNKRIKGDKLGICVDVHKFDSSVTESEIALLIDKLNKAESVHGIIIQSPLPEPLDFSRLLMLVSPNKDVDGLHPQSQSALFSGEPGYVACTPKGILKLIQSTGTQIEGKRAVVVGRSRLVGKPAAMLLLNNNATVSVCHSKTHHLGEITRTADILVCAVGHPNLIKQDMVKPGAIVIDVGMNRVNDRWHGDVDFEGVSEIASYITPVPGGVGPMTVAMLMDNTVLAAEKAFNE
ncbi:MAG: tetrahydrofolate dehydrogenase/cyclohydrolase catalytic domain-containing protein [Clostridia bacterium]